MHDFEKIENLRREKDDKRRMIDGELNRISLTDDPDEMIRMMGFLMLNITDYMRTSRNLLYEKKKLEEKRKGVLESYKSGCQIAD